MAKRVNYELENSPFDSLVCHEFKQANPSWHPSATCKMGIRTLTYLLRLKNCNKTSALNTWSSWVLLQWPFLCTWAVLLWHINVTQHTIENHMLKGPFLLPACFPSSTASPSKGPLNEHEMICSELETGFYYGPIEDTLDSSTQQ